MGKIYIVGLGPGSIEDLTLGAINRIKNGKVNLLRTENHPTVKYLTENNISYKSYDYLYDSEEDFQELYSKIVDEIVRESELYGEVNYLVPGNPMVAEKTVEILLKKDLDIEIISGMSFIEPILEALNRDPINGLKIVDATKFTSTLVDINVDILITQVYNKRIISDIKIVLSEIYGDEYSITVIHNAGIEGEERIHNIPIYLIDRIEDIGYLTSIYLPKIENPREVYDINNLIEIMRVLRGEDGCPWDIKQDHKSLRQTVIEEAYEVADAIDRDDVEGLIEELGDLLLQIIFHSEIANDEGEFNLFDVSTALVKKLIYRHPHIFLEKNVENSKEVVYNWNKLKDDQRGIRDLKGKLEVLPALPSLIKSYKIQARAADFGFDWDTIEGPLSKVLEEYYELVDEIRKDTRDEDRVEEELGDLLLASVNLSRFLNLNPEVALNKANNKFINRLLYMEKTAKELGRSLEEMDLEEMDILWNKSKENLN